MTCEHCEARLSAYLDSELPTDEAMRVRAHIDTCATCARKLSVLMAAQAAFRRHKPEPVDAAFAARLESAVVRASTRRRRRIPWSWRLTIAVAAMLTLVIGLRLRDDDRVGSFEGDAAWWAPGMPVPHYEAPAGRPGLRNVRCGEGEMTMGLGAGRGSRP